MYVQIHGTVRALRISTSSLKVKKVLRCWLLGSIGIFPAPSAPTPAKSPAILPRLLRHELSSAELPSPALR